MKLYEKPNMDILNISAEDIVTMSLWVDKEGAGDTITGDEVFGPLK